MAFQHILTITLSGGAVNLSARQTVSGDSEQAYDIPLTASQENAEVDMDFIAANLKSIYILSDQNLTVKTNDSSSPDDTITVAANTPFAWNTVQAADNPFTADVSKVYLTNESSTSAARVQIEILYDAAQ